MIDNQTKEHIKALLPNYLEGKGINIHKPFHCLNPEHDDRNPSMSYDPKRNRVKCFSCEKDADIFGLIGLEYDISNFKEQYNKALELLDIEAEPLEVDATQGTPNKEQADYYKYLKQVSMNAHHTDYANKRGLSDEIIKKYSIGFDAEWQHPKLVKEGKNPPKTPRLIIPIDATSYLARDTRSINDIPQEQRGFVKVKIGSSKPYLMHELLAHDEPTFIVEGEIDALSVIEAGYKAVALGSTSNIYAFINEYKEMANKIPTFFVMLDSDSSGVDASIKLSKELSKMHQAHHILKPYGYKDPNEYLVADREGFTTFLSNVMQNPNNYSIDLETIEKQRNLNDVDRAILQDIQQGYLNKYSIEMLSDELLEVLTVEEKKAMYEQNKVVNQLNDFTDGIKDSLSISAIPTGFETLDNVLDGGLFAGLYFIGAISSLGKTTFALQIADQIAKRGTDVLIFSLEMSRHEVMAKSISRLTYEVSQDDKLGKTTRGILDGKRYTGYTDIYGNQKAPYNSKEKETIKDALTEYAKIGEHLYINEGLGDIGSNDINRIITQHIKITGNKPVVVIDYLQILQPKDPRASDKQNTDWAVLDLKKISRAYNIPIIGISSFNRDNYKEAVNMASFKESGAIEYSSDVLIGLQLKGIVDSNGKKNSNFNVDEAKSKTPREIELKILKNRNGRTGNTVEFAYNPLFNYFKDNGTSKTDYKLASRKALKIE